MTKAAIYARYSSDRQRQSSIDDQVRNCKNYAAREGHTIVKIYTDEKITGSVTARPGYKQLLLDADAGVFDVLIIDDLSRLSRDDIEMKSLVRNFLFKSIRLIAIADGYDNHSKGHKIHAGVKSLMNELYLDDLREKTKRGMTGQALQGFNCGGRTYGYKNVPIEDVSRTDAYGRPLVLSVRYEIDKEQAEYVRKIYTWYSEGYSYKWIASALNKMHVPSSRGGTLMCQ